jgi:hypothetical protein
VPYGIGSFDTSAFVLNGVVCDRCNKRLGDELDIVLARDSIEGLDYREKHNKKLKSRKGKPRVRLSLPHSKEFGNFGGIIIDTEKFINEKTIVQLSQVHLTKVDGKINIFLREDLEATERINSGDYDLKKIRIYPDSKKDQEYLITLLREKGIDFKPTQRLSSPLPSSGPVTISFEVVIDRTLRRAIAKIAFNLAAFNYPEIDLTSKDFYKIRKFVLEDQGDIEFTFPKSFLAQESDRVNAATNSILLISEVRNKTLFIKIRLYDLGGYEIPIGTVSANIKPKGYSLRPGETPVEMYSPKRGTGLLILQADFDPLKGPIYRQIKL